jgi:hypothetical protein
VATVDPEIMVAIGEFAKQVTVPILYEDPKVLDQVGTGTLFMLAERYFLVTAAHLFENTDPARFAIPSNPIRDPNPSTLGRYHLFKPTVDFFDVAVLELLESPTIEKIKVGWRVLGLENTARASPQGTFALCGYPSERARFVGTHLIGGSLITAYSERMPEIPESAKRPVIPDLDLFFHYDVQATGIDGKPVATPHLGGTSGASVWEYREPDRNTLWTPERAFKIVGEQSSFRKGDFFRAKSWRFVSEILRKADTALATAIDAFDRR